MTKLRDVCLEVLGADRVADLDREIAETPRSTKPPILVDLFRSGKPWLLYEHEDPEMYAAWEGDRLNSPHSEMSEVMIERVARAILRAAIGEDSPRLEEIYEDQRYLYDAAARAAIEAMLTEAEGNDRD
jgi:hypothetical protein